jgi:hypothetical protein
MTLKKLIQQLKDLETLNTQVKDFNIEIDYPNPFQMKITITK